MRHLKRFVWVVVLVLSAARPGAAQRLEGRVTTGDDNAPLPGVQVVIAALERGTVTDEAGAFVIDDLPTGTHTVAFRFVGFETETRQVSLSNGESVRLDVALQPVTLEVDEVVVMGEGSAQEMLNRASLSVATLDAAALDDFRGQTLGEMLVRLPGVTTLTTGPSIAKPVVRGLHSQRLIVLNAGVPQEGQQWGGEHAPEIDPFAPARIEVIRGSAGVEYGVGAIGGVIRVEPRELPTTPVLGGRAAFNAFSNNRQAAASFMLEGGPAALPGFGWRMQASARKAGDARTPEHVIGNSAFEELDATAALGYHTTQVGIDAYFSHFGTQLGLFQGAHIGNYDDLLRAIERGEPAVEYDFSYGIDAPKQRIQHELVTLRGHYRLPSGDRLEAQYGFQYNQRKEYDAHRRFGDPLDEPAFSLVLTTHTLDLKLRTVPRGRWFGVAGLSGMNQANRNGESGFLIPNFRALTGGAFARGTYVRGPMTLEAGARLDHRWMEAYPREDLSSGDFLRRTHPYTSASGVVGAIWQFAPTWSIASNVGTAWRPPGVNELYSFGVHHGTAQFEIGDAGLGPERSVNVDATLRHAGSRVRLEASAYRNAIDGYLHLVPTLEPVVTIRGTFPAFRNAQADAVLRGIDGSLDVDVMRWLAVGVRGAVVRGTDRDHARPLFGMPADRVALGASVRLPDWGVWRGQELEAEGTFVRRQTNAPEGMDYAPPPDGYTLVGLGYRTEFHLGAVPLDVSLTVENLFDMAYRDYLSRFRYFIDDPGRNVVLRVQVPFGSVAQ